MKLWFDITNTPQVHFLLSVLNGIAAQGNHDIMITTREFSETVKFLGKKTKLPFEVVGGHYGKSRFNKARGLIHRFLDLNRKAGDFDVSLSCGSKYAHLEVACYCRKGRDSFS